MVSMYYRNNNYDALFHGPSFDSPLCCIITPAWMVNIISTIVSFVYSTLKLYLWKTFSAHEDSSENAIFFIVLNCAVKNYTNMFHTFFQKSRGFVLVFYPCEDFYEIWLWIEENLKNQL